MMKKTLVKLLDFDEDGDLDLDDVAFLLVRHEWLFVAGVLITIGSMSNVLGYTNIDSDLFWAFAGLGMALEYIDDMRRRARK
jgi:hypothetical protein